MQKSKKLGLLLSFLALSLIILTACGLKADYTTKQAESALNAGKVIDKKTVSIKVQKVIPNSAFGYNIETGKHLNFVSSNNPDVKKGQSLIVKVKKVQSFLGSYIIDYSIVKK